MINYKLIKYLLEKIKMKENLSIGSIYWFWFWFTLIQIDDMFLILSYIIQRDEICWFNGKKKVMICLFSIYLGENLPISSIFWLVSSIFSLSELL